MSKNRRMSFRNFLKAAGFVIAMIAVLVLAYVSVVLRYG